MRTRIERMAKLVEMLAAFQERTSTVIAVPDLARVPGEPIREWQFADALLRGHEATATYPEDHGLVAELEAGVEVGDGDTVIVMPLTTTVGSQRIELGEMQVELKDATVVIRQETHGRAVHVFKTQITACNTGSPRMTRSERHLAAKEPPSAVYGAAQRR